MGADRTHLREATASRTVTEQVEPAPHRPRGPGSKTSPQQVRCPCVCAGQGREPRGASDLNPQPLGFELNKEVGHGLAVMNCLPSLRTKFGNENLCYGLKF